MDNFQEFLKNRSIETQTTKKDQTTLSFEKLVSIQFNNITLQIFCSLFKI